MSLSEFKGVDFSKFSVIVKTLKDYEGVVAEILKENFPGIDILAKPLNFSGLILVGGNVPAEDLAREIKSKIPEVERVLPVKMYVPAEMNSIIEAAKKMVSELSGAGSFAVNTVRRGRHDFTSIDVNVRVGAIIKEGANIPVNLDFPDKVVFVEIVGPHAYMGIVDGSEYPKKIKPGKFQVRGYFKKVSVVQMPYLGDLKASHEMGIRIGREVQTFEVGELIIAPIGAVKANELNAFIKGIFEGIESRYQIQTKSYPHKPHKTQVYIQNLYELVRERAKEPIIVFEPEGEPINKVSEKLANLVIENERTNFLIGSREGIPLGVYRFANLVIDLCPGVTIATDLAAASALTALAFAIHQKLSSQTEGGTQNQNNN
jgi:tRNA acetyltransferase TAN1